jgi:hypothetical protein
LPIIQRFSFTLMRGDTKDFQVVDLGVPGSRPGGGTKTKSDT